MFSQAGTKGQALNPERIFTHKAGPAKTKSKGEFLKMCVF